MRDCTGQLPPVSTGGVRCSQRGEARDYRPDVERFSRRDTATTTRTVSSRTCKSVGKVCVKCGVYGMESEVKTQEDRNSPRGQSRSRKAESSVQQKLVSKEEPGVVC